MTDPFTDDAELAAYEAAQRAEYAKWEAAEVITTENGIPIYDVGHPVGLDNVARLGYAERGQVRLQPSYVDDNQDDPDVKHFLAFAKKNPGHPAAKAYAQHQERAVTTKAAAGPVLTFGGEGDKPKAAAPAEAKTTTTKG